MKKIKYKDAREKAGFQTQTAMAKAMNMNNMQYCLKENYERSFKDFELAKFCDLVDLTPKQLVIKNIDI